MTDRRYNDKEIAAIFRAAAEGPQGPQPEVPLEDGLTLTDLQAIGRDVGISPTAVAQARPSPGYPSRGRIADVVRTSDRRGAYGEPEPPAHRSRMGATGRPVARRLQRPRY